MTVAQVSKLLLESLSSLKRLNLAKNGISELEPGSLQRTRGLTYLNISHNSLREVGPATFEGLTRLFELDLSHNELVTLSDNTFTDQRELEFVNLSNNQIQLVSSQLFPVRNRWVQAGITQLPCSTSQHPRLDCQTCHRYLFRSLFYSSTLISCRIRFLDFSANFITNFPSAMIKRLGLLTRLGKPSYPPGAHCTP